MLKIWIGLTLAASLLAGCSTTHQNSSAVTTEQLSSAPEAVSFSSVSQGTNSGILSQVPKVYVINTPSAMARFWANHDTIGAPRPTIDFNQHTVIAVIDQKHDTSGYKVHVAQVDEVHGKLLLQTHRKEPGQQCATTTMITQPFDIIQVSKTNLPAQIEFSDTQVECS